MRPTGIKLILFNGLALAALILLSACTSTRQVEHSITGEQLSPGDLLEVRFKYYPDLNQAVVVSPNGDATLKSLGSVPVAGLTRGRLKRILRKRYSELLAEPDLTVLIQKASMFTVYVGGRIKRPGLMKFKPNLTVAQGILLAGGIEGQPSRHEIYVFRNVGSHKVKKFKIELSGARKLSTTQNFKLAPFDVIFVVKAGALKNHIGREV